MCTLINLFSRKCLYLVACINYLQMSFIVYAIILIYNANANNEMCEFSPGVLSKFAKYPAQTFQLTPG